MQTPSTGGRKAQSTAFLTFAVNTCEALLDELEAGELAEWAAPFEMARACRGHPDERRMNPIGVAEHVYRQSERVCETWMAEEDFVQLFSTAWRKVRVLPGNDVLTSAAASADRFKYLIDDNQRAETTAGFQRFISFCGHLCIALESDRIKLPCREVGEALGVMKNTVSSYRQQATEIGYLIRLKEHLYKPGGKGEATLFRFRVELWDELKKRVRPSA